MYTVDIRTNYSCWNGILDAMTAPGTHIQDRWTAVGGFRSHYYAPRTRTVEKVRVNKKVAWERLLLPLLVLACVSAYRSNSALEQQYQQDAAAYHHALGK